MKVFKLGMMVEDSITKVKGMLTHLSVDMDKGLKYIFQPRGLNPKTGKPVDIMFLDTARVKGGTEIELELPMSILGTKAEDMATGFKGKVVTIWYHINGCLHVELKPEGTNEDTGATFDAHEFDIRRVKGEKIPVFTEEKLQESIKFKPSPVTKPVSKHKK